MELTRNQKLFLKKLYEKEKEGIGLSIDGWKKTARSLERKGIIDIINNDYARSVVKLKWHELI